MAVRSDNEKLELVFLKLGLADTDEQLQTVIQNFLPPVLSILATNDENTRTKVMELLTHLNKRLKSRETVQLPVERLLHQFNNPESNSFIKNFSITYIKTGFPRLPPSEKKELLPFLFHSLKDKPSMQQDIILKLIIESLPLLDLNSSSLDQKFEFSSRVLETDLFLDICLDFLLLPYSISSTSVNEVSATSPPGLSKYSLKRLLSDVSLSMRASSETESIKAAILNLIKTDIFPQKSIICHLVVASADTKHTIATTAEVELKRFVSSLDWNDVELNMKLYKLYLGQAGVITKKTVASEKHREPADIRLKLKLISMLSRSMVAGECFPQTLQVAYDGLFGKTNAKLQLLTLQFIHAIIDKGQGSSVQQKQAPLLFDALVKVSNNQEQSSDIRALGFIGLGKLSKKFPELFQKKLVFLQSLFEYLEKEDSERVKESLQESLLMMASAFKDTSVENQFLLETLVEKSVGSKSVRLQLVGVHYASATFPYNHVPSRYQLLLALSQTAEHISQNVQKLMFATANDDNKHSGDFNLPKFDSMLTYVYEKAQKRLVGGKHYTLGGRKLSFPPKTFQSTIIYLRRCLLGNPHVEFNNDITLLDSTTIVNVIREMLSDSSSKNFLLMRKYVGLCLEYLSAISDPFVMMLLLEAIAASPDNISIRELLTSPNKEYDNVEANINWMKKQVLHTNEKIRQFAAESYSIILHRKYKGCICDEYCNVVEEYVQLLCSKTYEQKHGSMILLGFLFGNILSSCKETGISLPKNLSELGYKTVVILVNTATSERDASLAIAACSALGEISRKASLPLQDALDDDDSNTIEVMETDSHLSPSDLLSKVNRPRTKLDVVNSLTSCLSVKTISHQLREALVVTLGRLPVGDVTFAFTEKVLSALLTTSEIKNFELHFTVGSSLCSAALGRNSLERLSKWDASDDSIIPDENNLMNWLLDEILNKYVTHRIPAVRQASAVWLMVMMKNRACIKHPNVRGRLIDLHNAFELLLSEPDELTQDIASKGFGIVYELADADLKKHLVNQLVESLTGSRKTPSKVRILDQEDTPLLPGSASIKLGKTPDRSNLSTYKELCSFASDLNQPDLVYKFMQLANHHSHWNSKKGAAFGFRSIAEAAREELAPYLPRIVPRLYRYTFDPHPPVRAAMTSIWNVITPSSQKVVRDYFSEILDDLLKNLTSHIWRNREASCLALNNLLQSGINSAPSDDVNTSVLIERLVEMWKTLLRVADDIKETVRKAALDTCKGLKKTTLRLCDGERAHVIKSDILSDLLTVLMNEGLNNGVSDVKKLSLTILVEISKLKSDVMKPCIAQMVGKLLEALSGMEDPLINYIQARGNTSIQGAVDESRIQIIKSDPLMETAVRCLEQCDSSNIKEVVLILIDLIKRAAGTPTKAACSYAIRTLADNNKEDIQPFCNKLMNALLSALRDRSIVIRKLHAYTIGCVAVVATDEAVEKVLNKMKDWYLEKEDVTFQHASALVVKAIAQKSPDVLTRHSTVVLPLAFYGMHEESGNKNHPSTLKEMDVEVNDDENIGEIWKSIWVEFTPGVATALNIYFNEIFSLCSSRLESNQWKAKAQAGRSLTYMIEKQHNPAVLSPHLNEFVKALISSLRGRNWEGKHYLVIALKNLSIHCDSIMEQNQKEMVISTLLNESKRGSNSYKLEVINALSDCIASHNIDDKFEDYWRIIAPKFKDETGSSDSDHDDDRISSVNMKWKLKENIISSFSKVWKVSSTITQEKYVVEIFALLIDNISSGPHTMHLVSLNCLADILPTLKSNHDIDKIKTICQSVISPICTCIGDIKYLSTRESALKVFHILSDFLTHLTKTDRELLYQALKSSPINSNIYHDYDLVLQLLNSFNPA